LLRYGLAKLSAHLSFLSPGRYYRLAAVSSG
jgi:hypothetical protein